MPLRLSLNRNPLHGFIAFVATCHFMGGLVATEAVAAAGGPAWGTSERPNVLIITVDDMNCDSVGSFGCKLPGTTPHIDALAREGMRFFHAHVQVGNCMPSRNVMYSGRYPHNNRVEGFYQVKDPDYPTLNDVMKSAGYFTAIRGKVGHSTPYQPYAWDLVLDTAVEPRPHPKQVRSYYESTALGIRHSLEAQKPFCLIVNVSDPHKPFYGQKNTGETWADPNQPSRVYTAEEVPVPGFLPDHPVVRKELAHYYSSVRRADDCVGGILRALDESGKAEQTLVLFLSDHGMPLPFAKTQLYHHSTRTPWIIRWPGVVPENQIDQEHMISAVDLLPTLLEAVGAPLPEKLDGRSFLPLLHGKSQPGRDWVFKEYNENSGGARHPMRSVESKRFGYIFNPWSDGRRTFKTATTGTQTYRLMRTLAATDEQVAARLQLFDHRVREEFYDYQNDPDALNNLIDHPDYQDEIQLYRQTLGDWMRNTGDPCLVAFEGRHDAALLEDFMVDQERESALRRKNRPNAARKKNRREPGSRRMKGLIAIAVPSVAHPGGELTVELTHQLQKFPGKHQLHVTLKGGNNSSRLERKVLTVSGDGKQRIQFPLAKGLPYKQVVVAAFVGPDFSRHLEHVISQPIPIAVDVP